RTRPIPAGVRRFRRLDQPSTALSACPTRLWTPPSFPESASLYPQADPESVDGRPHIVRPPRSSPCLPSTLLPDQTLHRGRQRGAPGGCDRLEHLVRLGAQAERVQRPRTRSPHALRRGRAASPPRSHHAASSFVSAANARSHSASISSSATPTNDSGSWWTPC